MDQIDRLRMEVKQAVLAGRSIDDVDSEVIDAADVGPDVKAALWLYGWSWLAPHRQREVAMEHLRDMREEGSLA